MFSDANIVTYVLKASHLCPCGLGIPLEKHKKPQKASLRSVMIDVRSPANPLAV